MIAVIFELITPTESREDYLKIAAKLKPKLTEIEGFISIERFQSLNDPEKLLSLSFWKDEQSVLQWRNLEVHRQAQTKGRTSIFRDYQLRIAQVNRNYSMLDREEAPIDSNVAHNIEAS